MFSGKGGALDQGQQIALHAFTRHVSADTTIAGANFVDLVKKDDAVVFDRLDRFLRQLIGIEQFIGLLVDQNVVRIRDCDAAGLGSAAAELSRNNPYPERAPPRAPPAREIETP